MLNKIDDEGLTESKYEYTILILAANKNFENLINNYDSNIQKSIISKFQLIIEDWLKNPSVTYDQIMNKIDGFFKSVVDYQANKTEAEKINLINVNRKFEKNQNFNFSIGEIIASRPDFNFIDFIPNRSVEPVVYSDGIENGIIEISNNSISGTSASKNGEYTYNIFIKIIFLIEKTEITIHFQFKYHVGYKDIETKAIQVPEYYNNEEDNSESLVRLLIFIASCVTILFSCFIFNKFAKRWKLKKAERVKFNQEIFGNHLKSAEDQSDSMNSSLGDAEIC